MLHRIETNVPCKTQTDIANVKSVIARKVDAKDMASLYVCSPTGCNIVIEITGNGALLRDVAFALDCAGMLD